MKAITLLLISAFLLAKAIAGTIIPGKLPSTEEELRNHLTEWSTYSGITAFQVGEEEIRIASLASPKLNFTNYNDLLSYARTNIREVANFALTVIRTNPIYDPKKVMYIGFTASHLEESGDFRYWGNLYDYRPFPVDEVNGQLRISESFVNSWEPQISKDPMFQFGSKVVRAYLYEGLVGFETQTWDTFFRPGTRDTLWLDQDGLRIETRFLLWDQALSKNWFIVVLLEDGTSFKIGKNGVVSVADAKVALRSTLDLTKVEVVDAAPGTSVTVEVSTDFMKTWSTFGRAYIGPDGTGIVGFHTNSANGFFRVK